MRHVITFLSFIRRVLPGACGVAALSLVGCASVETRKIIDLTPFKHVFVEHLLTDDKRVDETIVTELNHLGYVASSGPLTMMPDDADAVLSYEDRWEWDFRSYMIEFNVTVRTARTKKKLADGHYYQPTPNSKSPAEVVSKVLTPLFAKK